MVVSLAPGQAIAEVVATAELDTEDDEMSIVLESATDELRNTLEETRLLDAAEDNKLTVEERMDEEPGANAEEDTTMVTELESAALEGELVSEVACADFKGSVDMASKMLLDNADSGVLSVISLEIV